MFRWYENAVVCYVYLSDAIWCADAAIMNERLRKCRWFTRGWTLQELIAPRNVEFYSTDWRKIATKDELCGLLSSITGIDEHILRGANLTDVSIARRMSWASRRKTTRREDIAYCLLGIFDVNLPLIYGEGLKAFRRLQEAIMNTTHDQSLFAWGYIVDHPSGLIDREQELGLNLIPWKPPQQREPLLGLFAESPEDFDTSSEISPVDHGYAHHLNRRRPPTVVNGGALIDLVIFKTIASALYWDRPAIAQPHKAELAVLLCRVGNTGSQLVGLVLHSWGDNYYSRTKELILIDTFVSHVRFQSWTQTRHIMPQRPFQLRNGDILLRRWICSFRCVGVERPTTKSGPAWRQKWQDRVLRLEEDVVGDEEINFFFEISRGEGVAITLRRISKTMKPIGSLLIGASPFGTAGTTLDDGMKMPNWIPKHRAPFRCPAFSHIMKIPSDTWKFEVEDLPRIYAKVDRMLLDEGSGAVDVVDFIMGPDGRS
jgi:hypothetical protein